MNSVQPNFDLILRGKRFEQARRLSRVVILSREDGEGSSIGRKLAIHL
jgi:hypothetical protein